MPIPVNTPMRRAIHLFVLPLASAFAVTACGGGGGHTSSTDPAGGPTMEQAAAIAKTTLVLPAASTAITRSEKSVYTNGTYESAAFNWTANTWSDGGSSPDVAVDLNTNNVNAHSGSNSAHFKITSPAATFVLTDFSFSAGKRYKVTAWVKADTDAKIELLVRGGGPGYFPYAIAQTQANAVWQQITIEGIPNEATNLFLNMPTGVNVYLDDLQIFEITQDELAPANKSTSIPDTMFGLHINRLGTHNAWPKVGQKVIRLHDTGTHWCDLETSPGTWDFSRLDYFVQHVEKNDASAVMIYNMGQSPTDYSSNPSAPSFYCGNKGASSPPKDMAAWRNYVTTIGQRYKNNNIRYWEIWNEWDIPQNYSGDVTTMVEMARIANDVLKGINANNKIVAPSVTARLGTQFVERFLKAGGGAYVDIMNMHAYEPSSETSLMGAISNIRTIMAANGVDTKPLWNTEGSFQCDPLTQPGCVSSTSLSSADLAAPLRNMLLMWTKGVSNFNYYHWEGINATGALVYGLWEKQAPDSCAYNPDCPTPLGKTHAQAVTWLKSATLTDAYAAQGTNGRIYVFKMLSGGKFRVILWTDGGDESIRLPKEKSNFSGTTWDSLKYAAKLDGNGTKTSIPIDYLSGSSTRYKYITVSVTPTLLTSY